MVVDQDVVSNRVSIDRITRMPRGPRDVTTAALTQPAADGEPEPAAEYVIHHLVGHRENRTGTQYKIRWYGYAPVDDTWEPAEGLPQAFIDRFCRTKAAARHR